MQGTKKVKVTGAWFNKKVELTQCALTWLRIGRGTLEEISYAEL